MLSNLFSLFIFFQVLLFGARQVYAQVVINEVHPNPASGSEWVELYNPSSAAIDLSGWKIMDQLSAPSIIHTFANQVIEPLHYLVIEISNKLNNAADGVILINEVNDTVDSMSYNLSTVGQSWSRVPDALGTFQLAAPTRAQTNSSPEPTPHPSATPTSAPSPSPSPTSSPSPSPSPSPTASPSPEPLNLQLSEIMACPSDGDTEWIEVFNPNAVSVVLEDWKVRDSANNLKTISTTLGPQSLGLITWSSSLLNNTGDSVTLLTPSGQSLFTATFGSCVSGTSFLFIDGSWQETASPTKQSTNLYTNPHPSPSPSTSANPVPSPSPTPAVTYLESAAFDSNVLGSTSLLSSAASASGQIKRPHTLATSAQTTGSSTQLPSRGATPQLGTTPQIERSSAITDIRSPEPSRRGVISVIMGGLLLVTSSGYQLYDTFKNFGSHLA